jgi:hypothetical protein
MSIQGGKQCRGVDAGGGDDAFSRNKAGTRIDADDPCRLCSDGIDPDTFAKVCDLAVAQRRQKRMPSSTG